MSENIPVQEIVIIRRGGGGGDEGHHGGMWKIAFADFMTAMMAFFLVMWLINATDEKTKAEISTYFNPIKLPDQSKAEKALQSADSNPGQNEEATNARTAPKGKEFKGSGEEEGKGVPKKTDEALFADPYGILSRLATQAARLPMPKQAGMRKDGTTQFSGGSAFRDPFDPDFRKRQSESIPAETPASEREEELDANIGESPASPLAQPISPDEAPSVKTPPLPQTNPAAVRPAEEKPPADGVKIAQGAQPPMPAKENDGAAGKSDAAASAEAAVKQLETDIRQALRQAGLQDLPDIAVTRTAEGLLISLTDKMDFEMFALASAQPKPELVVAMERLGKLLQARGEKIIVRGHTDARPFRSATYDNWRLSSDRANMAHFMLARGGLPEARFLKIEGYADKELKVPGDPKAAGNRRIEILLRQPVS